MGTNNRTRYTDNEATNTSLGQVGSIFIDTAGAVTPPAGLSFIAITMVAESTFNSTDGLLPEDGEGKTYIGTNSASDSAASGGQAIDSSNTFPAGLTIFGRWSKITHASGAMIAYIG
tara:strand:- start:504 stop:854 length:351 start_codon:yes stop_codon:yes gene_type:complete